MPGRLPIVGNETVLDAINYAGGLTPTASSVNIRLVRPAPPGACCEQVLPVNLAAIVNAGDPTTNYQLMPGDRIVVYRDPIVRTTIFLDRIAAPFNSVLNSIFQYSFTARGGQGDQPADQRHRDDDRDRDAGDRGHQRRLDPRDEQQPRRTGPADRTI